MTTPYKSDMKLGKYSFTPEWGGEEVTIENVEMRLGWWRSYIYGDVPHPNFTIWDKVDDGGRPLPGAHGKPGKLVNIPIGWVEGHAELRDNTDILRLFRCNEHGADSDGYYVEYDAEKPEFGCVGEAPDDLQVVPMGGLSMNLLIFRSGYQE